MEPTSNVIGARVPLTITATTTSAKKDNKEEESDLINSFFLPGGILDPEDSQADQSQTLGGGKTNNPPQESFYLPPVEESWSSARPLGPQSPPQQPNNSNALASDFLLSKPAYQSSDSLFGGLHQQPPGLKLPSDEHEEITWLRAGTPSIQSNLPLDAFHGRQDISLAGNPPRNQTSILQSENNAYYGSPRVSSPPAASVSSMVPSFSMDNGSGDQPKTTGTIGLQLEKVPTSGNIVMEPPPGFHAISPTASTAPTPVPPKEVLPTETPSKAKPPKVRGRSRRSKASSDNDDFQTVNPKVRQNKESSATENTWVEPSSKSRGSATKDKRNTPSRKASGDTRTYFEPLAVMTAKLDDSASLETEQGSLDGSIEGVAVKIVDPSQVSHDATEQDVVQIETIHTVDDPQTKSRETISAGSPPRKQFKDPPKKQTKTTPRSKPRGKNDAGSPRRSPEHLSSPQDPPQLNGDSNGSAGSVLELFQGTLHWMDEILFPAVKQTFSKFSGAWKTLNLCAAIVYHLYSYAIQDIQTYEKDELFGLTFFQIPLISNILMGVFGLPQFTPHLLSYGILFYLCRPRKLVLAGSAETPDSSSIFRSTAARRKDRVAEDFGYYLCRTSLMCLQISLPFVFIFEGFEKPQTAIMRLTQGERIVVFYFLRSLRESIILSPIIWVTLLLQAILARLSAPGGVWLELVVIQCSLAIGMASVSFVRKQGEIGDGLKS
eukprot:scaffold1995_cov167-Amphora_coffeaeformis.AAC.18